VKRTDNKSVNIINKMPISNGCYENKYVSEWWGVEKAEQ
jgi:hypothetical protein